MAVVVVEDRLAVMVAHTCAFGAETSLSSGSDSEGKPGDELPISVAGGNHPGLALRRIDWRGLARLATAAVEPT